MRKINLTIFYVLIALLWVSCLKKQSNILWKIEIPTKNQHFLTFDNHEFNIESFEDRYLVFNDPSAQICVVDLISGLLIYKHSASQIGTRFLILKDDLFFKSIKSDSVTITKVNLKSMHNMIFQLPVSNETDLFCMNNEVLLKENNHRDFLKFNKLNNTFEEYILPDEFNFLSKSSDIQNIDDGFEGGFNGDIHFLKLNSEFWAHDSRKNTITDSINGCSINVGQAFYRPIITNSSSRYMCFHEASDRLIVISKQDCKIISDFECKKVYQIINDKLLVQMKDNSLVIYDITKNENRKVKISEPLKIEWCSLIEDDLIVLKENKLMRIKLKNEFQ